MSVVEQFRMIFNWFFNVLSQTWQVIIGTFLVFQVVLWLLSLGVRIIKKVLS